MQELQRGVQEEQEVRNFLRGADLTKPETRAQLSQFGKTGLGYGKLLAEQEEAGLKTKKLRGDIDKQALEQSRERTSNLAFNPSNENILAHLQDSVLRGEMNDAQAQGLWAQVKDLNPDQRKQTFLQLGANAAKRLEQMTLSESQKQTLNLQAEGQRLQYDPTRQGQIAGAKATAQEVAKREAAGNIDVTSNRKALAQAGYDVSTGKDDITDLIKKSTGSYIGKAVDIGGRTFGTSTAGSEALAALEQKANAITFGLLNGKLGAGISKSDAELVASLVGKLGDGTLPVGDRLAAWDSAKTMMKNLGMVAEPTGSPKPTPKPTPSSAGANSVTIPGGKVLSFPTPEAAAAYKKAAGL
jgi:CRISPR/Cas system-associated endoribonuclease Cas2